MDNGMQNMLEMYLFETNSLLEELDNILLAAEKDGAFSTDDVNEIFRIMHTIKGSSAMMQFNSLSTVAHHVENLFFHIREEGGQDDFGRDLFDLLFQASDFIKLQVEKIQNNEPISEDVDDLVNRIESMLKSAEEEAAGESAEASAAAETEAASGKEEKSDDGDKRYTIRVFFDEDVGMENLRAYMLVCAVQDACADFTFEPPDVEHNTETSATIIEKGFLLHFSTQEDLNNAVSVVKNGMNVKTYEVLETAGAKKEDAHPAEAAAEAEKKAAPPEPEKPKKEKTVKQQSAPQAPQKKEPAHFSTGKQSLISVNLAKLDGLMALVGEIVITESMVTSNPDLQGLKLDNFIKSARQLRKLTDELQDTVMSIRMVPIAGAFQKMNRIVRDMSKSLGKPAKLEIIGAETEVDKTIVDTIGDPIMHMVRNSMDHGLEESPELRVKAGKPEEGTIRLSAEHNGSEVIIKVEDDGRGVDIQKVMEKAKSKNLLMKPESEYTDREIMQFLFMPGFSTNENVTEYSGRGVGMDVVKKNIEKVSGIISMTSEPGQGSCTTLKIPLTMAIVDGMEIAVGKTIFTVPIQNIRQSFKISEEEIIVDATGGEMVRRMEEYYPVLRVHDFYNIPTEITKAEDGIMIWVEASDKSYCLFADELLGEQQVVVKALPTYLNSFNIKDSGIAGCTIRGDGNISIILDILNLYEASMSY